MNRLNGKVALVTGAGRGIGEATARKLAAEGAKVAVVDIDETSARRVASSIDPSGHNSLGLACDISDYAAVMQMVEQVMAKFGHIDILVNNAGITSDSLFHKMSLEQWQRVIDVNLTGTFNVCRAVVPYMQKQQSGRIVNVSSVSAYGNPGQANYAASKAGIIGLTKSLAKELGRYNITVNTIEPGLTATDMIKTIPGHILEEKVKKIPLGRPGQPEDQANVICFLASDEASFITGVELQVCGGSLIN